MGVVYGTFTFEIAQPPRIAYLSKGNIIHPPPPRKSIIRILKSSIIKIPFYKNQMMGGGHSLTYSNATSNPTPQSTRFFAIMT